MADSTPVPTNRAQDSAALFRQELLLSVRDYSIKTSSVSDQEWLAAYFAQRLPQWSPEACADAAAEITVGMAVHEEKKQSLRAAQADGMGTDNWIGREVRQGACAANVTEFGTYLTQVDVAIRQANIDLAATITTAKGRVSQNPNLDGFIFESDHAASFNMDAALKAESVRAKVLRPEPGQTYAKNSADIAVVDAEGNVLQEVQAKCYRDAEHSNTAFEEGDYGNQGKLVPKGHEQGESTSQIQQGNVKSRPVSKEEAKTAQGKAQKQGDVPQKSWDDFTCRELGVNIGKQTLLASAQGAIISTSISLAVSLAQQEEIDGEELLEVAITSGSKSGATCATAGALKVAAELDFLPHISLPAMQSDAILTATAGETSVASVTAACCSRGGDLSSVLKSSSVAVGIFASVVVDGVQTAYKVATGEMTATEGYMETERSIGAAAGGVYAAMPAAACGAAIGALLGPAGAAVCGFVGGVIGGIAGSAIGRKLVEGAQKVRSVAVSAAKSVVDSLGSACKTFGSACKAAFDGFCDLFGF